MTKLMFVVLLHQEVPGKVRLAISAQARLIRIQHILVIGPCTPGLVSHHSSLANNLSSDSSNGILELIPIHPIHPILSYSIHIPTFIQSTFILFKSDAKFSQALLEALD